MAREGGLLFWTETRTTGKTLPAVFDTRISALARHASQVGLDTQSSPSGSANAPRRRASRPATRQPRHSSRSNSEC